MAIIYLIKDYDQCVYMSQYSDIYTVINNHIETIYNTKPNFTTNTKKEIYKNSKMLEGIYITKGMTCYQKKINIIPGYIYNSYEYLMERIGKFVIIEQCNIPLSIIPHTQDISNKQISTRKIRDMLEKIDVTKEKTDKAIIIKEIYEYLAINTDYLKKNKRFNDTAFNKLLELDKEIDEFKGCREIFDPKVYLNLLYKHRYPEISLSVKKLK